MVIPVGEATHVPVALVLLPADLGPEPGAGEAPRFLNGTLIRLEPDVLRLAVPAGTPAPPLGMRVIVSAGERTKMTGKLLAVDADGWTVSRDQMRATDDRAAPRVRSRIQLRWRHADPHRTQDWLSGADDEEASYSRFGGGGDLSLSGIRVDVSVDPTTETPQFGDRLFIELMVGGATRRVLGVVRRVEEGERTSVAIEFLEVPEATFDALSDYTLRNL
jgi:PilZ domain